MKHRRKIWSIPIAVLALVLMLAGALAVSGIVQAQTPASAPSTVISSVEGAALNGEDELAVIAFKDLPDAAVLVLDEEAVLASPSATPPTPAIPAFVNAKIVGGPKFDSDGDGTVESDEEPLFVVDEANSNTGATASIAIDLHTDAEETDVTQKSYSITVEAVYDLNNLADGPRRRCD